MDKLYYSDYCHQPDDCVALEFRDPQEAFPEYDHDFDEIFRLWAIWLGLR